MAPCRTFAGALPKAQSGGEISVLDPGSYGPVTINKSISITNDNAGEATVLAEGGTGIAIGGIGTVVHLRGLVIDRGLPGNPGATGIRFSLGGGLHIQNCVIRSFAKAGNDVGNGILFAPLASAKLTIRDTHIARNGAGTAGGGIVVKPQILAVPSVTLTRVTMDNNSNGLVVDTSGTSGAAFVAVGDSSASANGNTGIALIGNGGSAQTFLTLERVQSVNNSFGVTSTGSDSNVTIGKSVVSGNTTGLSATNSGKIVSYLNNVLLGNTNAGAPTSTQAGQ